MNRLIGKGELSKPDQIQTLFGEIPEGQAFYGIPNGCSTIIKEPTLMIKLQVDLGKHKVFIINNLGNRLLDNSPVYFTYFAYYKPVDLEIHVKEPQ